MTHKTKVLDLQKLLTVKETEQKEIAARQQAQRELDNAINGFIPLPLLDPVTLSRAKQAKQAANRAKEAFQALPKPRRELAESVHKTALAIALDAARRMGGDYSGTTSHKAWFGSGVNTGVTAWTITDSGDAYSRSCSYRRTDATHKVQLDSARVHALVESARLREMSAREGLPLIALDDDGAAVWLVSKAKQIASQSGWIIGCNRCCYHSTKSREDAVKGHARKLAAMIEAERAAAEREKARKASPEYKAERRARLIARLCGNAMATIEDAKECGYCTPGIEQFQRSHGIGDKATLPQLVKTGNHMAIALALKLARKVKAA